MSEEQPAVAAEADTPAQGEGNEAKGSAQEEKSLEALLDEWGSDQSEPEKPAKTEKTKTDDTNSDESEGSGPDDEEEERFNRYKERLKAEEKTEKDFQDALKTVKGDLPISEDDLEALLNHRARKNPALANAWVNRHKNPELWNKTLTALNREFGKMFQKQDTSVSDTDDAVASAVHSAATKSPEKQSEKNAFTMSDQEWQQHKLRKFGRA